MRTGGRDAARYMYFIYRKVKNIVGHIIPPHVFLAVWNKHGKMVWPEIWEFGK